MAKISRDDNKKRFRSRMYPTQQDFENFMDSYVHKDDEIPMSLVKSDGEPIIQVINRKAEQKHSHEIADVDQLPETLRQLGTDLSALRQDFTELQDALKWAEL